MGIDEHYNPDAAAQHLAGAGFDVADPLLLFACDIASGAAELDWACRAIQTASKRGTDVARRSLEKIQSTAQHRLGAASGTLAAAGPAAVADLARRFEEAVDKPREKGTLAGLVADRVFPFQEAGYARRPLGRGRLPDTGFRDFIFVWRYLTAVCGKPLLSRRTCVDAACALRLITPRLRHDSPDLTQYDAMFDAADRIPPFDIRDRRTAAPSSPARFLAAEVTRMTTIDGAPFRDLPTDAEFVLWLSWQHLPYSFWRWRQLAYHPDGQQLALHLRLDDLSVDGVPARYDIRAALQLPASFDEALSVAPEAIRKAQTLCLKLIALGMDHLVAPGISIAITPDSGAPK